MLRLTNSSYSSTYTLPAPVDTTPRPIMTRAGLDFSPLLETAGSSSAATQPSSSPWSVKLPSQAEVMQFLRDNRTAVYVAAVVLLVLAMRRR